MYELELAGGGRMPVIGLGTWQLSGDSCVKAVLTALKLGYRHVDTAEMYANEREVGEAIRASGIPRDEIFLFALYINQEIIRKKDCNDGDGANNNPEFF